MKTTKVLLALAVSFLSFQAMAQTSSEGKVGKTINKVGNKTAQVAVKGASAVTDKVYASKVGPAGQTIYINKNSHYYYVNARGKKVYISKAKLKDKPKE